MTSSKNDKFFECLESMQKFAEIYAKQTNTFFCFDPTITSVVIIGLANYKNKYGVPLCPCRNYHHEEAEIDLNYWICPCVSMRERKECHCTLFLTSEQEYASQDQKIPMDRILDNLKNL